MARKRARPLLVVVTGPTASGKTDLAISIARHYATEIVSADSRQIFRDIPVGTAAPSAEQLGAVVHHLIGVLDLDAYYSAATFEADAIGILDRIWATNDIAVVAGGSMMYIDALTAGFDALPTVSPEIRARAYDILDRGGIEAVRRELLRLDPDYYARADLNNSKRLVHAIEVSMQAGKPYSSLLTGRRRERHFDVVKLAIDMPRPVLMDRINRRVEAMVADGLLDEARRLHHLSHLNALNTVGYKELFKWLDGTWDLDTALARMAKNTRVYAKKQLTWLRRDPDVVWLEAGDDIEARAIGIINAALGENT